MTERTSHGAGLATRASSDIVSSPPICVLTGGTDGIGRIVARRLAAEGHHLVLLARDPSKAARACSELGPRSEWVSCDLASLASVRAAAAEVAARHPRVDLLINNAACFGARFEETADGFEKHLAVNYLAPFLLTHALLPQVALAPAGRVVNVSGETARFGRIRLDDLDRRRGGYSALFAYAQSKLALILFTRSLAARVSGSRITVNALHPGLAATSHLKAGPRWLDRLWRGILPGPDGATRAVVRLATDPSLAGATGRYYVGRLRAFAPCAAYDARLREALYARTAALVGLAGAGAPDGLRLSSSDATKG
jgi:NAD(P)-dependent dehydrogenase (short-subunit alcohol dehydrogenase family)